MHPYLQIIVSTLGLAALVGCQTFQADPLNASAHASGWRARTPGDESVRAFARRLGGEGRKSGGFNAADGITLPEAEVVALVYNPDLRLARLKANVARATADHAGRWDDPQLGIDVLNVTESVPNPWLLGGSLSLTLPVSGRLQAEKSRADAAHHAALAEVVETEWQTLRDLRAAWITWSANHLRLEETERMVAALDGISDTTGRLAESGELPRTEAALFTVEHETRKAGIVRLRAKVAEGEQEIRALLGLAPKAPARLRPKMIPGFKTRTSSNLADTSPTLVRLQSEYAVAELTLLREIRKQYPDIELGPQFGREDGQSRIGIIGAIPIPILNSNKGGIAAARAERELARAAFETGIERAEGRLATLRARLAGARASRAAIESNVVPLVDRQLADARRLVELGEGGSLVLLESITRANQAKLDLIEARHDERATENDIRHLLGPLERGL